MDSAHGYFVTGAVRGLIHSANHHWPVACASLGARQTWRTRRPAVRARQHIRESDLPEEPEEDDRTVEAVVS